MSDKNVSGMLACSKCGRTFQPPAFSFDPEENAKRKRDYWYAVRAHVRQCAEVVYGGNDNVRHTDEG
jgi:hypothetical protein